LVVTLGIGGNAVGLAALGVYAVMAFTVESRRREPGIRSAVGGVAALLATRILQSQLYGVESNDLPTFLGVGLVLAVAIVLASWLPARRALKVDPIEGLRPE
jgi:putative ABC transport system permease protein